MIWLYSFIILNASSLLNRLSPNSNLNSSNVDLSTSRYIPECIIL